MRSGHNLIWYVSFRLSSLFTVAFIDILVSYNRFQSIFILNIFKNLHLGSQTNKQVRLLCLRERISSLNSLRRWRSGGVVVLQKWG